MFDCLVFNHIHIHIKLIIYTYTLNIKHCPGSLTPLGPCQGTPSACWLASSRGVSLFNYSRKVSGLGDPVWGSTRLATLASKARGRNVSPSACGPASSRADSLSDDLRKVSGSGDPMWGGTRLATPGIHDWRVRLAFPSPPKAS